MTDTVKPVHEALVDVMRSVPYVAKRDRNDYANFNFRGIDAVLNAVGPVLREHRVLVLPEVLDHAYSTVEVGQNRTRQAHVMVTVRYAFVGPAGDVLSTTSLGEAMDSGDKATSKAMSVAFRTALLQVLALPTDEPDPDASTYERSPAPDPNELAAAKAEAWKAWQTYSGAADVAAMTAFYEEHATNTLAEANAMDLHRFAAHLISSSDSTPADESTTGDAADVPPTGDGGEGETPSSVASPPTTRGVSRDQVRKIQPMFKELGFDDRDERLYVTGVLVGREIDSTSQLTMSEARSLIDQLTGCQSKPDVEQLVQAKASS